MSSCDVDVVGVVPTPAAHRTFECGANQPVRVAALAQCGSQTTAALMSITSSSVHCIRLHSKTQVLTRMHMYALCSVIACATAACSKG
jgi:hypothetical protein